MKQNTSKAVGMKFQNILAYERSLARNVAGQLIEFPEVSVWEVIIPILFAFKFANLKNRRETFILNHLFTKELALKAARNIAMGYEEKEALARVKERTQRILEEDKGGLYSEKIRCKQFKEITLLMDHYGKLIEAEGTDYETLVINTYGGRSHFEAFLSQLAGAEAETVQAAQQTLGTKANLELASRIESITATVRMAMVDKIFGKE